MSWFQYHFDWHIFISHYLHLANALSFNSHKWFSLPSFCVCFLAAVTIKVTTELKWHWSDELMHLSISPSMVINRISATLSRKRQPSKGREKKRTINDIVHGLPSVHYISTENLLNSAHIFAVSCACNQWFESTERDRVQKWQRRLQLRNRNGEIFPHLYAVKSINIKYVCIFSLEVLVMLELHPPNLPLSWWFLSNQNWNAVSEHIK